MIVGYGEEQASTDPFSQVELGAICPARCCVDRNHVVAGAILPSSWTPAESTATARADQAESTPTATAQSSKALQQPQHDHRHTQREQMP